LFWETGVGAKAEPSAFHPWLTITGRSWPGVLKLYSSEVSWLLGLGMPGFREKVLLQGTLCYHGVDERIRLQEQKLLEIFPGPRGPKKAFLTALAQVAA